ncbi:cilia- and flagella-associated protein HOATZ-like [Watersipora subatra]|uniref:cilia- and flagella-associated protein HOATZ-like n=1 Tax=Watersipora subatra TaxID=2589382 RepID=UPI00355BB0CC
MAAHIVSDFPISDAKTVFTGTSEENTAYLKTFWKSIHLNPTIESRLVSSDVRQRIAPCPIKTHEKQKFKFREEDPLKLTDFTKNVFKLESEDQHKKRMAQLDKREQDMCRHKMRKDKREKVQSVAKQQTIIAAEPLQVLPPIPSEYNDDLDPAEEELREAFEAFDDIERFEKQLETKPKCKQPVDETAISLE